MNLNPKLVNLLKRKRIKFLQLMNMDSFMMLPKRISLQELIEFKECLYLNVKCFLKLECLFIYLFIFSTQAPEKTTRTIRLYREREAKWVALLGSTDPIISRDSRKV